MTKSDATFDDKLIQEIIDSEKIDIAALMALGDIAVVLSEDAVDADNLTPNQRGLIMSCCAQVSNLSDLMHAEMDHLAANQ